MTPQPTPSAGPSAGTHARWLPRSRRLVSLLGAGLALCLAGCASSPVPVRWHTLLPPADGGQATPATTQAPLRLLAGPVGVPAQLDQPQWVLRLPDNTLQVLEQDRWAAPLRDELQLALFERLGRRWAVVDARLGAVGEPVWRLDLAFSRIEARAGQAVDLEGRWALLPPAGQRTAVATAAATPNGLACSFRLQQVVAAAADNTPPALALAAAHRQAVQALADQIGQRLRALAATSGQPTPACP